MKIRVLLAAVVAVVTFPSIASAQKQPWIKDRRYGEGIGIRTGNLELHPGIAGEVGYDSNYFQRADEEDPVSAIRFRVTPSLTLSTLSDQRRQYDNPNAEPPKLKFRAGLFVEGNVLIFDEDVDNQNHVAGGANFLFDILPEKPVGMDLYGNYTRTVEASNDPNEDRAFDRDAVRLGAGASWRPGGGLFEWRFGYEFRYHYFEQQAFQNFNNSQHYVNTRGRWRFLPRTALLGNAELGFVRYSESTTQNDSDPVRAMIGINGLVTNHFALLGMVGWGASFTKGTAGQNPNPQSFDSVIGQAELKWFLTPQLDLPQDSAPVGLSSIAAGYTRNFSNSYLGDYYQRDRGYANFSYFAGGVVLVSVEGGLSLITYPDIYIPVGGNTPAQPTKDSFSEKRADVTGFVEYRLSDSVGINTTLRYTGNLDDNDVAGDNLQFNRYEAYLGLRWFM